MDTKSGGLDKRIVKTKKAMQEALAELLMSKSIGEISVTELCKKADISRKTFYSHYDNINDVVDDIFDEVIDEIIGVLDKSTEGKDTKELIDAFASLLFTGLAENSQYDRYMESPNRAWLLLKMQNAFALVIVKEVLKNENLTHDIYKVQTVADYIAAGLVMAIHNKKRKHKTDRNEEAAELLAKIAIYDLSLL